MSLEKLQQIICRLLSNERKLSGESYISGDFPLSHFTGSKRISIDIDIFNNTNEALGYAKSKDLLISKIFGCTVSFTRELLSRAEAIVSKDGYSIVIQWVRDSAFRFSPLIEDPLFGLTAHPFNFATNKVFALVGRMEIRDWIDTIL